LQFGAHVSASITTKCADTLAERCLSGGVHKLADDMCSELWL
jgi:hypothetical protein